MSRPKIMIIVALLLAVLAAGAGYLYLQQLASAGSHVQFGYVVVAKMKVAAKKLVTREMVEEKRFPLNYISPGAARRLDDVIGKTTGEALVAGEQVELDRLIQQGNTKMGFPYLITKGKRAVTISVDEVSAVGWQIQPGDRVDIIVTMSIPNPGYEGKAVTLTPLQNIKVLAVGQSLDSGSTAASQAGVKTMTLEVSPQEAERLVLVSDQGKIRMTLRTPLEEGTQPLLPAQNGDLLTPISQVP